MFFWLPIVLSLVNSAPVGPRLSASPSSVGSHSSQGLAILLHNTSPSRRIHSKGGKGTQSPPMNSMNEDTLPPSSSKSSSMSRFPSSRMTSPSINIPSPNFSKSPTSLSHSELDPSFRYNHLLSSDSIEDILDETKVSRDEIIKDIEDILTNSYGHNSKLYVKQDRKPLYTISPFVFSSIFERFFDDEQILRLSLLVMKEPSFIRGRLDEDYDAKDLVENVIPLKEKELMDKIQSGPLSTSYVKKHLEPLRVMYDNIKRVLQKHYDAKASSPDTSAASSPASSEYDPEEGVDGIDWE